MTTFHDHTIVAIASPLGTGAISIIRISGALAFEIAHQATQRFHLSEQLRYAHYVKIKSANGAIIDDGILTLYSEKQSFTGEPCAEFTGHGGMCVTQEVLMRFIECGATPAKAGEFSQRAFINGKIDLTQAEAIIDVISSQNHLALRAARNQLDGALGKRTTIARDQLLETLAHLEAWIDFPEEDIDPASGNALIHKVEAVIQMIDQLLLTAHQGRILREGVRTVIYGNPNVGKSSLLNHLTGYNRAIVSDIAGTTRDSIEELVQLDDLTLKLIDTAGIRQAQDPIEAEGIHRTHQHITNADVLLAVYDASLPQPEDFPQLHPSNTIIILNKCDLGIHPSWHQVPAVHLSCKTNLGFDTISKRIRELIQSHDVDWGEQAVAINARHQHSLKQAKQSLLSALELLQAHTINPELGSLDLRDALDYLGEIPGKTNTEDLLGVIFSQFCIGK